MAVTPEVPRVICSLAGDPEFYRRGKNNALKQALLLYGQLQYERFSSAESDGVVVCDRSVLDHWVYSKCLFEAEFRAADVFDLYETLVSDYCKNYDKLFYIPVEFPPIDDGVRESDIAFQASIDGMIAAFLNKYSVLHTKIGGTIEERCVAVEAGLEGLAVRER